MSVNTTFVLSDESNPKGTKLDVSSNIFENNGKRNACFTVARGNGSVTVITDNPQDLWTIAAELDSLARDLYERNIDPTNGS
ncbi:MAG TPA: hypothetical protein VN039_06970 [Nitrospira sp.]|nr:hypothetical protein [Nitrospira sp.]